MTPYLKQTSDIPDTIAEQAFEALRSAWRTDFAKWIADATPPFFTNDTSPAMRQWGASMMLPMSVTIATACNRKMVDTDFRAELRGVTTPTLLIHGTRARAIRKVRCFRTSLDTPWVRAVCRGVFRTWHPAGQCCA